MSGDFFSPKETMSPEQREQYLFTRLQASLVYAKDNTAFYGALFKDIDPEGVNSREALAKLPVTRKSELIALQSEQPPFGGMNGIDAGAVARLFQSPGPIHEPEGAGNDWWRLGQAFHAAGFRAGDIVHNTFSYHLSPGGFMMDSGARACDCAVIPAGVGQTEHQLSVMASFKPDGYCGTPSFLKTLLSKADTAGQDLSFIKRALVSGEGLPERLRKEFADRGIRCLQAYATADVGLIAYESDALDGMIVAEDIILEVVKPGTGEPVGAGEVGEILVTVFNREYPLVRFATGDLTALLPGESPCGRTNRRIKGWLGRADQSTKVKGLFVHPGQVVEVVRRHPDITRARLLVESVNSQDQMTLLCEAGQGFDPSSVEESLKTVLKLKGKAQRVGTGDLQNDGRVIEDTRV